MLNWLGSPKDMSPRRFQERICPWAYLTPRLAPGSHGGMAALGKFLSSPGRAAGGGWHISHLQGLSDTARKELGLSSKMRTKHRQATQGYATHEKGQLKSLASSQFFLVFLGRSHELVTNVSWLRSDRRISKPCSAPRQDYSSLDWGLGQTPVKLRQDSAKCKAVCN